MNPEKGVTARPPSPHGVGSDVPSSGLVPHSELRLRAPLSVACWLHGTGLALLLLGGLCFTTAVYLGSLARMPRFDREQAAMVDDDFPAYARFADVFGFTSFACGLLSVLVLLLGFVLFAIYLYRAWRVIQDRRTPVSPGLAVGLLFVPFVNLAWVFIGLSGLASEINSYAQRHALSPRPAPSVLGFSLGVLFIGSFVPVLGLGAMLLGLLLLPVYLRAVQRTLAEVVRQAATADDQTHARFFDVVIRQPGPLKTGLAFVALLCGIVGTDMLIVSGVTVDSIAHDYLPQQRRVQVAVAAVAQLRAEPALPAALEAARGELEDEIDQWNQRTRISRDPVAVLLISGTIGVVLVSLAVVCAVSASRLPFTGEPAAPAKDEMDW